MAANLISVGTVQPAPGAQLAQSPQSLVITFNQPNTGVDQPNYALFDSSGADFQLEQINSDGSRTPVFDLNDSPPPEVSSELATTTRTVTTFTIPLQSSLGLDPPYTLPYDLTLQPGTYELELVGGTGLSADASGSNPGLWDSSQPHVISRFTVLGAGASLAGATPLGTIGSNVQTVFGSLNPDDFHSAVAIYQFKLGQGHFWQVGLSIGATSIGSGLLPALALFDANGNVLATRNAGTGLPSDPNDPYILTGLAPGTYYVGVSGAANLPDVSGGYDPIMGTPGAAGLHQPGGPFAFQLGLIAQPHDYSTKLVSFSVDRADPNDPSPTGLTLTFNGPIDLSNLFVPDTRLTALKVIDSSGREWSITAEGYQVQNAQLTLVFDQPLPEGHYSLVMPALGGLTDLAGQPVNAAGEPAGVLADWTVVASTRTRAATDLGVVWPAIADGTNPALGAAFSQTTSLAPGQSATYRWVVTVPGFYKLQTQVLSGTVSILNLGNGQTTVLAASTNLPLQNNLIYLSNGVYGLRFTNVGSKPATVHWTLKTDHLDWEKIVDNGVSQQSALSIMLFSPVPSNPESEQDAAASLQGIAGASTLGFSGGPSGPLPTSLFVTANTGLLGLQPSIGQTVAPVGPMVDTGSIAVADSSKGLQPGIRYESVSTSDLGPGNGDPPGEVVLSGGQPTANDEAIRLAAAGTELRLDPGAASAQADDHALGQAEWLVRLGSRINSWLTRSPVNPKIEAHSPPRLLAQPLVASAASAIPSESTDVDRNKRSRSSAHSDIGAAATLIVAGTVAFRLRQPLQKWWRGSCRLTPGGAASNKPLSQGPHWFSTRARAKTHARRTHASR
jgi:hypothetical protein